MHHAGAVHPCAQHFDIAIFARLQIGFHQLLKGFGGGDWIGHHKGQFEHFGFGEAARGIAHNGHDDIGHAIHGLIHQVRRAAPQRHGIVMLDLQGAAGALFHACSPGFQDMFWHRGRRWQELVQAQGDILRSGDARRQAQRQRCGGHGF